MEPPLQQIIGAVRLVLEQTPPELSRRHHRQGHGHVRRRIAADATSTSCSPQVTGVPCHVPTTRCTASLSGRALPWSNFDFFKKYLARSLMPPRWKDRPAASTGRHRPALHTSASFDSSPAGRSRRAGRLSRPDPPAVTDHDRIDGALRARGRRPGRTDGSSWARRFKTADGDLIAVFIDELVRPACRRRNHSPPSVSRAACRRSPSVDRACAAYGRKSGALLATSLRRWTGSRRTTRA